MGGAVGGVGGARRGACQSIWASGRGLGADVAERATAVAQTCSPHAQGEGRRGGEHWRHGPREAAHLQAAVRRDAEGLLERACELDGEMLQPLAKKATGHSSWEVASRGGLMVFPDEHKFCGRGFSHHCVKAPSI